MSSTRHLVDTIVLMETAEHQVLNWPWQASNDRVQVWVGFVGDMVIEAHSASEDRIFSFDADML